MVNKRDPKSDQPCKLSHQFIRHITKDFDETLIIGSGAFGTVYKGVCESGEEMAVKKLHNMSFDSKGFQKEFENLRRLKHQNVVLLKGFCNESEEVVVEYEMRQVVAEKMHTALCFEFVRNGSLSKHISADGCSGLNWHAQYKIIKGICDGLEYLRHGLEFSVWHLDLKPGNILLDENMIPKIADFGLSRILGDENTRRTMNKNGTCGYMPPEYIEHGLVTKEFDIFSLGVIIVKLMAGREGYSKIDEMTENRFVKMVHASWRKRLRETLGPRPLEVYCEQVKMCIQIAVKCMKRNRQERPTIQFIVSNLIDTEILIGKLGLQTELMWTVPMVGYAYERLTRTLRSSARSVKKVKVAVHQHPATLLSLQFSKPEGFRYKSGQYIFVKCPVVSPFKWHPFFITSAPEDDYVSVHIKTLGHWTNQLRNTFLKVCPPPTGAKTEILRAEYEMPNLRDGHNFPMVLIDGPYGAPARDYKQYDTLLLVGQGIRATPMISIIKDVITNAKRLGGEVESDNGHPGDSSAFRTRRAYFYWASREPDSLEWFRGVMDEVAEADEKRIIELHNQCTSVCEEGDARAVLIAMLQSLNEAKNGVDFVSGSRVMTHFGYPNWRQIYKHIALENGGKRVGVFYCGKPALTNELRDLAKDFSRCTSTKFEFHKKNF